MDDALDHVDSSLNAADEPSTSLTLNISSKDAQEERKPQMLFHDRVDNQNTSWVPWVATGPRPSYDSHSSVESTGSREVLGEGPKHPLSRELEDLRYSSYQLDSPSDPITRPQHLDSTPFLFVNDEYSLAQMTSELTSSLHLPSPPLEKHLVLAIDLENHSYHSFHGFTSLIQLSTRDNDYVIDPLVPAIREKIGQALWPFLTHPSIVKIVHGSDRDVEWLQRDFGLYIVNSFDTGQAARVLALPSAGLAFLLETFCGVLSDKRFQLSDWRIRPLTTEMLSYARTDTHYLPYLYDRLRSELLSLNPSQIPVLLSSIPNYADDPELSDNDRKALKGALGCVLERSRRLCLNLYERETTGPETAIDQAIKWSLRLNPMQLGVFCSLYEWRDRVCRAEDESGGYVMPKAMLTVLAQEMPGSLKDLKRVMGRSLNQFIQKRSSEVLAAIMDGKSKPREMRTERKVSLTREGHPILQSAQAEPLSTASSLSIKPRAVAPLTMKSGSGMFGSGFGGSKLGAQGSSRPAINLNDPSATNGGVLSRSFITSLAALPPPTLPHAAQIKVSKGLDPSHTETHPPAAPSDITTAKEVTDEPHFVQGSQVRSVMEGLIATGSRVVTLDAQGQEVPPPVTEASNNPYLLPAAPKDLASKKPGGMQDMMEFVPVPLSEMKREERKMGPKGGLRDPLRGDRGVVEQVKRKYIIGTDAPSFGGDDDDEDGEDSDEDQEVVRGRGRGGSLFGGKKQKVKKASVDQSSERDVKDGSSSFKPFDYEAAASRSKQVAKEKQAGHGKTAGKRQDKAEQKGKGKRPREKTGAWSPDAVDSGGNGGGIRGGKRQRNAPAHGNKSRTFGSRK